MNLAKHSIKALLGMATRAEIDAYYGVYEDSLRRWGKTAAGFYPRRLFHNLFRMPEFGKTVRLWLASLNGRVIGGILMFYHQEHAVYWHGCSHSAYLQAHPSPLPLPDAALEQLEEQDLIRQGLQRLGDRCRRLLDRLFYSEEPPSYADLARELAMPEGSIGPTRARCLERLRTVLGALGF